MESRLDYYTTDERRKLQRALATAPGSDSPLVDGQTMLASIDALQAATSRDSGEWVYWYALGDCYQSVRWFSEALAATARCYALRPEDPRSSYALATSFRLLSRARLVENLSPQDVAHWRAALRERFGTTFGLDPEASQGALESLGMSLDEAAAAAIHFFGVAESQLQGDERALVRRSISLLCQEFPHLGMQPDHQHLAGPLAYVSRQRPGAFGYSEAAAPGQLSRRTRLLLAMGQSCQQCGAAGPVHHVKFESNVGLLVIRFRQSVEGNLCWPCIQKEYRSHTTTNWLLGWWGIISFFATISYLSENSASYYKAKLFFEGLEQRGA